MLRVGNDDKFFLIATCYVPKGLSNPRVRPVAGGLCGFSGAQALGAQTVSACV
jgi:hypothetical protein